MCLYCQPQTTGGETAKPIKTEEADIKPPVEADKTAESVQKDIKTEDNDIKPENGTEKTAEFVENDIKPAIKTESPSFCCICFNTAAPSFVENCIEEIKARIQKENWQQLTDEPYRLHLVLPNECVIRQAIHDLQTSSSTAGSVTNFRRQVRSHYTKSVAPIFENRLESLPTARVEVRIELSAKFVNGKKEFSTILKNKIGDTGVHRNDDESRRAKRRKLENGWTTPSTSLAKTDVDSLIDSLTAKDVTDLRLDVDENDVKIETIATIIRDPVILAGRYCKYSRMLPQTPWTAGTSGDDDGDEDGQSEYSQCVSDLVACEVIRMTRADSYKFVASGREDVDVRMLGEGRPFALEVNNCRTLKALDDMGTVQSAINKSQNDVSVRLLCRVDRTDLNIIKSGEIDKHKQYTCVCRASVPVSQSSLTQLVEKCQSLLVDQKTPIRVLARRTLMSRHREVTINEAWPGNHANTFFLRLTTQAGTYVKEFVNGDFGRTVPSVPELLGLAPNAMVELLELDVDEVKLNWPPARNLKMEID